MLAAKRSNMGFTLVEIIVTLIAAGILGTIFINLMGTALNDSWNSVEMVRNEAGAVRKMEQIIADYVENINGINPDAALVTVFNAIDSGAYNEPPTAPHTITVTSGYIQFVNGVEKPGIKLLGDTIKVTVQAGDSRLTTILTKSRRSGDRVVRY